MPPSFLRLLNRAPHLCVCVCTYVQTSEWTRGCEQVNEKIPKTPPLTQYWLGSKWIKLWQHSQNLKNYYFQKLFLFYPSTNWTAHKLSKKLLELCFVHTKGAPFKNKNKIEFLNGIRVSPTASIGAAPN